MQQMALRRVGLFWRNTICGLTRRMVLQADSRPRPSGSTVNACLTLAMIDLNSLNSIPGLLLEAIRSQPFRMVKRANRLSSLGHSVFSISSNLNPKIDLVER